MNLPVDHSDPIALKRVRRELAKGSVDAINELKKLAGMGSVKAAIVLGKAYQSGVGGRVDTEESEMWFRRAASTGAAIALFYLGRFYFERKQFARAYSAFTEAAEANYAPAFRMLGIMYRYGIAVKKNADQSVKLFARAAEGGDIYGRIYFAQCLIHGTSGRSFGGIKKHPGRVLKGIQLICGAIRDIILNRDTIE